MQYQAKTLAEVEKIMIEEPSVLMTSEDSAVNEEIKLTIQDFTRRMVYNRDTPKGYKRRGEQGGLLDLDNITVHHGKATKTGRLFSIAQDSKGNFTDEEYTDDQATAINEGWGDKDMPYNQPSKHLDTLREELGSNLMKTGIVELFKIDLATRGFRVK